MFFTVIVSTPKQVPPRYRHFFFTFPASSAQVTKWVLRLKSQPYPSPGMHKFAKNLTGTSKFQAPKGEIKQVPYCGPTTIGRHRTKHIRQGDLTPDICVPLPSPLPPPITKMYHVRTSIQSFKKTRNVRTNVTKRHIRITIVGEQKQ